MAQEKLDIAKSAAIATAELLDGQDCIGVYAFDSSAHPVLPMTKVSGAGDVVGQLSGLSSGRRDECVPGHGDGEAGSECPQSQDRA